MINTPFNYTGSKFKILDQIIPEMDFSKKTFTDLFTGSFVVGCNVVHLYDKVVANDVIKDLIGIHKGLIESDDIIEQTKLLCPNKDDQEGYIQLRKNYNVNKTPSGLFALMLSCTNNMIRYNLKGEVNQSFGRRSWNDSTSKKVIEYTNYIRPYKYKIEFISCDFSEVIINEPSMVYIDPPYSNTEAGYSGIWKVKDDIRLYEYCKELDKNGSSFMVSGVLTHDGKSCLLLDKLIGDGYSFKELDFNYDKVSRKGKKETTEIIIKNY